MSPEAAALVSILVVSLLSLIGVVTLGMSRGRLKMLLLPLVALAAGAMLGDTFLHLIPETVERHHGSFPPSVSFALLAGMVAFFLLEKVVHWQHSHEPCDLDHVHPVGIMNLIGDALHNLLDGILIAGAYLAGGIEVGIGVTIAVMLHEIPQEIGDFAILVHAGFTPGRALFFNLLSALAALVGGGVVFVIGARIEALQDWMIPFTAGGFLYIAAADLIPEIRKEERPRDAALLTAMFIAGIVMMSLLELGGHDGGHGHEDDARPARPAPAD